MLARGLRPNSASTFTEYACEAAHAGHQRALPQAPHERQHRAEQILLHRPRLGQLHVGQVARDRARPVRIADLAHLQQLLQHPGIDLEQRLDDANARQRARAQCRRAGQINGGGRRHIAVVMAGRVEAWAPTTVPVRPARVTS